MQRKSYRRAIVAYVRKEVRDIRKEYVSVHALSSVTPDVVVILGIIHGAKSW